MWYEFAGYRILREGSLQTKEVESQKNKRVWHIYEMPVVQHFAFGVPRGSEWEPKLAEESRMDYDKPCAAHGVETSSCTWWEATEKLGTRKDYAQSYH